jgi:N-acetyl-anhydromuramyl-L-alanine amidase AmpD
VIYKKLPSHCHPGRNLKKILGGVLHFISGINVEPSNPFDMQVCWNLLHDLNLPKSERKYYPTCAGDEREYASYNILVGREEGEACMLLPISSEAWHAGVSLHKGVGDLNKFTFGVALIATENSGYTDWQYKFLHTFFPPVMQEQGFSADWIPGHDQVRYAATQAGFKDKNNNTPKPKKDPSGKPDGTGGNFDWERFRGGLIHASGTVTAVSG